MKSIVRAIMEDVYYPIEIDLDPRSTHSSSKKCLTLKEAKELLADLESEIEIIEWEEEKKRRANPEPEVSEKRAFAERMGMSPSSIYS
jgi:hypothetical protein